MQIQPGIVVVNKPVGLTSHDVVNVVRRITGERRVGHIGTLDPSARGVLVLLVGREATKQSAKLRGLDKEYVVTIEFGRATDTLDATGVFTKQWPIQHAKLRRLNPALLSRALTSFVGKYKQTVPLYSAVKVGGVKLYQIARGQRKPPDGFVLPSREVEIKKINLVEFCPGTARSYPRAKIRCLVSSGTYTRSLVRDIGQRLGLPSYQTSLLRTRVGKFTLRQACSWSSLVAGTGFEPVFRD